MFSKSSSILILKLSLVGAQRLSKAATEDEVMPEIILVVKSKTKAIRAAAVLKVTANNTGGRRLFRINSSTIFTATKKQQTRKLYVHPPNQKWRRHGFLFFGNR